MLETLRFFAAMRRNFRTVGAIAPSGPSLARAMCKALGPIEPGRVLIELGPGTGPFTRRLRKDYPDSPLLSVEFDDTMAARLKHRFPDVQVICGCASDLRRHLDEAGFSPAEVGGVVSGLPFLSLPPDLRTNIFSSIAEILPSGRPFVQFTYSRSGWKHMYPTGFKVLRHKRIFLNVPPAVVLPFVREGDGYAA